MFLKTSGNSHVLILEVPVTDCQTDVVWASLPQFIGCDTVHGVRCDLSICLSVYLSDQASLVVVLEGMRKERAFKNEKKCGVKKKERMTNHQLKRLKD